MSPASIKYEVKNQSASQQSGQQAGQAGHDLPAGHDLAQIAFWLCLSMAAGAAGMVLSWPVSVGLAGQILLLAFGAVALVMLLWTTRGAGRQFGVFPPLGASGVTDVQDAETWLEALDEAAFIADPSGEVIHVGNSACKELSKELGSDGIMLPPAKLFASEAEASALIYRLLRAGMDGKSRCERLPPIRLAAGQPTALLEAAVSPVNNERILWRIRRLDDRGFSAGARPETQLIEDAPAGFFAARPDGSVIYANAMLRKLLELPEDMLGVRIEDIVGAGGARVLKQAGRRKKCVEVSITPRSGKPRTAFLSNAWIGTGAKALSRSVLDFAPLTRSTAIARSGKSAKSGGKTDLPGYGLLDAPFGVARLDGASPALAVIVDANAMLMEMTAGTAVLGTKFADLFEDDTGSKGVMANLSGVEASVEMRLANSGNTLDIHFIFDEESNASWAFLIDMSMRKNMELRLAQGEKMQAVGKLAGGVAHDFNNLLQGMMLNTDKLLIRHPAGDPSYFELKSISQLASRGAELVRMLLAYSRQQTFRQEVLDISDLLSDYHVLLRQLIDERIRLNLLHGRDLPLIRADRAQIETALTNLATNARDAMLEKSGGGELLIRTSAATADTARTDGFMHIPDGDYLLIEICDDGVGMPKDLQERVFDPFFSTKSEDKGTGLGLASVYGIVKQSGGFVYPLSEQGKGSVFKIFLPAYEAEDEDVMQSLPKHVSPGESNRPHDLAGRGRILLIEDEDAIRGVAAELLSSRGYQVMQAADGERALQIIKEQAGRIDLLISDVVLPGIDGPGVLRRAREHIPDARVIFISGYAEREFDRILDEDNISFLPKPFTLKELAAQVKSELETARESV